MISVIITAYNIEEYIADAIKSVLGQTYKDLQVVVVNDASRDNTAYVARNAANGDERVYIVSNSENAGAGMSRAIGLSHCKGKYVTFLDGDDMYTPTYIENLVKEAERTGADITSGGITKLYADGRTESKTYGRKTLDGDAKVLDYWGANIVYMNNRLIRRSMFDEIPYCTRRYIEDTPTIIPLLWRANKVAFIDDDGYVYRMRESSLTHTADKFKECVFRGLCICDLLDYFEEHDPSMVDKIKLYEMLGREIGELNKLKLTKEQVEVYATEWLELTRRVLNHVTIETIDLKQ